VKEIGSIIWHGGKAILFNPEIRAERLNPRNLIEDLATGAMAVDDGFNPFGDPFAEGGYYDEKDTTNQLSQGLGAFSRNTLITAATLPSGGVLKNASYAQKIFGPGFSARGAFAGRTVKDVAAALRSGALKPKDVPIQYIVRDGQKLIINTRSSQALTQAGVKRGQ